MIMMSKAELNLVKGGATKPAVKKPAAKKPAAKKLQSASQISSIISQFT